MPEPQWRTSLDEARENLSRAMLFGAEIVSLARGEAELRLPVTRDVGGGVAGGVHGGLLAILADNAVMAAVMTSLEAGDQARGTAELSISYLRPAVGAWVAARATVLRKGSSLVVADIDIRNDAGDLIAKSRATYVIGRDAAQ